MLKTKHFSPPFYINKNSSLKAHKTIDHAKNSVALSNNDNDTNYLLFQHAKTIFKFQTCSIWIAHRNHSI